MSECVTGLVLERLAPLKTNQIKLHLNSLVLAVKLSKSVSCPSDINSGNKISIPEPALLLPETCII